MALGIDADDYDENSVFNRLFAKEKAEPCESYGSRLAKIFEDVETPAEVIKASDFLPSY